MICSVCSTHVRARFCFFSCVSVGVSFPCMLLDNADTQIHESSGRLLAYPVVWRPHKSLERVHASQIEDQLLVLGYTSAGVSESVSPKLRIPSIAECKILTIDREIAQRSRYLRLELHGFRARAIDDGLQASFSRDLDFVCICKWLFPDNSSTQVSTPSFPYDVFACILVPFTAKFANAAMASTATPICLELASPISGLIPPAFAMRSLLSTAVDTKGKCAFMGGASE